MTSNTSPRPMRDGISRGDVIRYRGAFGTGPVVSAKVLNIAETDRPRDKYGVDVDFVPWQTVRENRAVFDLDDGHWTYSDQLVIPEDAP